MHWLPQRAGAGITPPRFETWTSPDPCKVIDEPRDSIAVTPLVPWVPHLVPQRYTEALKKPIRGCESVEPGTSWLRRQTRDIYCDDAFHRLIVNVKRAAMGILKTESASLTAHLVRDTSISPTSSGNIPSNINPAFEASIQDIEVQAPDPRGAKRKGLKVVFKVSLNPYSMRLEHKIQFNSAQEPHKELIM